MIDLKRLITQHDSSVPVFEQRLVHERQELQDSSPLRSYPDIQDGGQIMLIRLIPFQVFVKGMDGSSNTYTVPSKTPQVRGRFKPWREIQTTPSMRGRFKPLPP